ncbi:uncharacterized protein [Heliangelus exortis]|uniref:uncharacterized protein n=1 Tax=Heliangelus exortis TaxID=472823 RepID=UPI003A911188
MATGSEWSCPICCDNQEEVACLSPCLHQFCLGCALRWVEQNPKCPLCRNKTMSVFFSMLEDDDYLAFDVPSSAEVLAEFHQDEQGAVWPLPQFAVLDFPPEVWADFFKSDPINVRPLVPWVRRMLRVLTEADWWELEAMEGNVVTSLCDYGLDEEVLVRELQSCMPASAETFVRRLMAAATHLCGSEFRQHLAQCFSSPWWEADSPAASPSPGASPVGTAASSLASPGCSAGPDPRV